MPKFIDRTGETGVANNGMKMVIIAYRGSKDVDIQFEDGSIHKGISYNAFKEGKVKSPKQNRIGENNIACNGMNMCIIAYRGSTDIDVQFEDGSIATHKTYNMFKKGYIKNPKRPNNWNRIPNIDRIGESITTRYGNKMTIIAYRNSADIDVQFDDGIIVLNKSYDSFKKGAIWHPTGIVGESRISKCGINMSIMDRKSYNEIKVKFETGYAVKHRSVNEFYSDKIAHPFPYHVGIVSMDKPAYTFRDQGNFYCHCTQCGLQDIMTIQEMKSHKCIAK